MFLLRLSDVTRVEIPRGLGNKECRADHRYPCGEIQYAFPHQ
jgi:hypothetical protein